MSSTPDPAGSARVLSTTDQRDAWDEAIVDAGGHLRQSTWWAAPLERFGVHLDVLSLGAASRIEGGALVRSTRVPYLGLSVADCMNGPFHSSWLPEYADALLDGLDQALRRRRAIQLTIHNCPDTRIHRDLCAALERRKASWMLEPALPEAVIDLAEKTMADVETDYSKNTRRSVRKGRAGPLTISALSTAAHLRGANEAFTATARRQGFDDLRPWSALEPMLRTAIDTDRGEVIGALLEERVVAAVFVSHVGTETEYIYGGYLDGMDPFRPNHVLHDQAIRSALERGQTGYNLGMLPASGQSPGLARFKLGFGANPRPSLDRITWQIRPLLAKGLREMRTNTLARRSLQSVRRHIIGRNERNEHG